LATAATAAVVKVTVRAKRKNLAVLITTAAEEVERVSVLRFVLFRITSPDIS
jgi:hypothetical protein